MSNVAMGTEERAQYDNVRAAKQRLYGRPNVVIRPPIHRPYIYRRTSRNDAWVIAMRSEARHVKLARLTKELSESRRITLTEILCVICTFYTITRTEIMSRRRNREIAWPRQVAMYLARELTDRSYPEIGRRYGGRDHTTVLHACRAVRHRMGKSGRVSEDIAELMKILAGAQK